MIRTLALIAVAWTLLGAAAAHAGWPGDDGRLYFSAVDDQQELRVFSIAADGTGQRPEPLVPTDAQLGPTGQIVAFGGTSALFVRPIEGGTSENPLPRDPFTRAFGVALTRQGDLFGSWDNGDDQRHFGVVPHDPALPAHDLGPFPGSGPAGLLEGAPATSPTRDEAFFI